VAFYIWGWRIAYLTELRKLGDNAPGQHGTQLVREMVMMEPSLLAAYVAEAWHAHILVLGLLKLLFPFRIYTFLRLPFLINRRP
jgi:hypothetical protein